MKKLTQYSSFTQITHTLKHIYGWCVLCVYVGGGVMWIWEWVWREGERKEKERNTNHREFL